MEKSVLPMWLAFFFLKTQTNHLWCHICASITHGFTRMVDTHKNKRKLPDERIETCAHQRFNGSVFLQLAADKKPVQTVTSL